MATEEPYANRSGAASSSYISPTADFLLTFALAALIAMIAASVLLP